MGKRAKLIYVEDDRIAQMAAEAAFEDRDFDIDFFDTAEAAIKAIQNTDYDLVLLDVGLPDKDGYQLAKEIREIGKPIKIVGLSAHSSAQQLEKATMAGMDDFLEKPITEEVCVIIEKHLNRK